MTALAGGKHVVTANKAMLARHGQALAEAAEAAGVALRFEAAVAGGIPVVKALTEGLAGNAITRVMGVLNGTCNFILTAMEAEDAPYAAGARGGAAARLRRGRPELRRRRHRRGAEAGAAGGDRLRHPGRLSPGMTVEGIERVSLTDIEHAAEMGYRIKLLGVARLTPAGVEARMQPCLVPAALAARPARGRHQHGGDRGRLRRPDRAERAPAPAPGPTASAIVGDVIDIARGLVIPAFGRPAASLAAPRARRRRRAPRPTTCVSRSPTRPGCWRRSPRPSAPPASRSTGCARTSTPPPRRRC